MGNYARENTRGGDLYIASYIIKHNSAGSETFFTRICHFI